MKVDFPFSKFNGLVTDGLNDDGSLADFILALNVYFDADRNLNARRGFHWLASSGPQSGSGFYLGSFTDENMFPTHFFQISDSLFSWTGIPSDEIEDTDEGTDFESENRGAQFGGAMYSDGKKWDGTSTSDVTDYPGSFGPMENHNERLWCNDNCRLYFSAVGNADSWPAENFIDIDPVDSDTITDIKSFQNRLIIFRTEDAWVLETPAGPSSWSLRKLSDDGCDYQTAIIHDGILYWFGRKGAYSYNGVSIKLISKPIQNKWTDQIPFDSGGRSRPRLSYSTMFDDMFIVCLGLSQNNQELYCYDTRHDTWTQWYMGWEEDLSNSRIRGLWAHPVNTEWAVRGIYMFVQSGTDFFVSALLPEYETDVVPYNFDTVATPTLDDNEPVNGVEAYPYYAVFQTKWFDFGDPFNKKRIHYWMIEYASDGITIQQVDEEQRSVSQTLDAMYDTYSYQNKVRGIGYVRRVSLAVTFTDPAGSRWYLKSINAKVSSRGNQITSAQEDFRTEFS